MKCSELRERLKNKSIKPEEKVDETSNYRMDYDPATKDAMALYSHQKLNVLFDPVFDMDVEKFEKELLSGIVAPVLK